MLYCQKVLSDCCIRVSLVQCWQIQASLIVTLAPAEAADSAPSVFDERMLTVSSIKKVQRRTLQAARIEGRRWWSWWNLRVCLRESSGWHLGCTGYLRWGTASGFLGNRRSWIRNEHEEEEEEEGVIRKRGGGKSHEYATEKVLKEYKWNLLIAGIPVRVLGLYIVKWYVYCTLYSRFISCIFTYIIHI